jgi:hypothetical protein
LRGDSSLPEELLPVDGEAIFPNGMVFVTVRKSTSFDLRSDPRIGIHAQLEADRMPSTSKISRISRASSMSLPWSRPVRTAQVDLERDPRPEAPISGERDDEHHDEAPELFSRRSSLKSVRPP